MSEKDVLEEMFNTGRLVKLRGNTFNSEPSFFGLPTLHFMIKDTNIYLDVYPGIRQLNSSNHRWYRKIKVQRMFESGWFRQEESIKMDELLTELKKLGMTDLAKVIAFNIDLYA